MPKVFTLLFQVCFAAMATMLAVLMLMLVSVRLSWAFLHYSAITTLNPRQTL